MSQIAPRRLVHLMTFWFCLVSMGWTVTLHYCDHHLSGLTILGSVETCCQSNSDGNQQDFVCQSATKGACDNVSYSLDLDGDYVTASQIEYTDYLQVALLPSSERYVLGTSQEIDFPYAANAPPLNRPDIRVLYCSYLL